MKKNGKGGERERERGGRKKLSIWEEGRGGGRGRKKREGGGCIGLLLLKIFRGREKEWKWI